MSPRRAKVFRGSTDPDPVTQLREHLIDAGERLLTERGQVGSITTRDITRAAGVSDGVLYNYFADKNDLLVTSLVRRFSRIVGQFDTDLPEPGTGTVEDNLTTLALAILRLHGAGLPLLVGLLGEPDLLRRFLDQIHRSPTGPQVIPHRLIEYLAAEQALGRISSTAFDAATTLIAGGAAMLALSSVILERPLEELAAQLPGMMRLLVHGLAAPPAP